MSKNFVDNSNATNIITKIAQNFARLKSTMTRSQYEDAQTLAPGVYPIEAEDDSYVLSSDMVGHGNGTVEQALDSKVNKSGDTMSGNLVVDKQNGTASSTGYSAVVLGNSTSQGTDKNSFGVLRLYGKKSTYVDVKAPDIDTIDKDIVFPNKSGTLALTSDLSQRSFDVAFAPISGQTIYSAIVIERYGKVRTLQFMRQNGINHPTMTYGICIPNTATVMFLREEDRPRIETRCGLIIYRAGSSSTSGLVNGKCYPCIVRITTGGSISIEALTTDEILNIQDSSAYLVGTVTYIAK